MTARKRADRAGPGKRGGRQGARGGAPNADTSPGRRRSATTAIVSVLIIALVAISLWIGRARFFPAARPVTPPEAGPPAPDPSLTLQQESGFATRLLNEGHALESLPYYRHLVAAVPGNTHVRYNYIIVLSNAALESRDRPYGRMPGTRSSVERVELMREAFAQLDELERQVRTPHERAELRELRGRFYKNWGFPWETVFELRAAQALDPSWRQVAANANFFVWLMHHPDANLDSIP